MTTQSYQAWCNGRLLPEAQAMLPALDHAILYGIGLFETLAVCAGVPAFWQAHMVRLRESASKLGIGPILEESVREAALAVISANNIDDGRLRITVTAGAGEPFLAAPRTGCGLLVTGRSGTSYHEAQYRTGFRCMLCGMCRNPTSAMAGMKCTPYIDSWWARRAASAAGCDEAILTDIYGRLSEGSMSNLFWVSGEKVFTPATDTGLLPGVARQVIIDILELENNAVIPVHSRPAELAGADEAFLTSSLLGVMPITQWQGSDIGAGKPGPLTQRLGVLFAAKERAQ